ncbi:MAG TPA: hypothetical protein PLU64_16575, partial [Saprospiraceae bacterium]|nr:hypothetical protein [Saprospiraceae bacterium]
TEKGAFSTRSMKFKQVLKVAFIPKIQSDRLRTWLSTGLVGAGEFWRAHGACSKVRVPPQGAW